MSYPSLPPVQAGVPEAVPGLVGLAGTVVLLLILVAIAAIAYQHVTGGVAWPDEDPADEDGLRQGEADDEWDYY